MGEAIGIEPHSSCLALVHYPHVNVIRLVRLRRERRRRSRPQWPRTLSKIKNEVHSVSETPGQDHDRHMPTPFHSMRKTERHSEGKTKKELHSESKKEV